MSQFPCRLGLEEQISLLRKCVNRELALEDELSRLGLSYDDLRYRTSDRVPASLSPASSIGAGELEEHEKTHDVPFISFFTGAGGLDLGFEAGGFRHVAAIEINPLFCETLRVNRPRWTVLGPPIHSGDIRNKDEYSHLLRQGLGVSPPFEGVFIGGPPCQSFSIAANQRFRKVDASFKRV